MVVPPLDALGPAESHSNNRAAGEIVGNRGTGLADLSGEDIISTGAEIPRAVCPLRPVMVHRPAAGVGIEVVDERAKLIERHVRCASVGSHGDEQLAGSVLVTAESRGLCLRRQAVGEGIHAGWRWCRRWPRSECGSKGRRAGNFKAAGPGIGCLCTAQVQRVKAAP